MTDKLTKAQERVLRAMYANPGKSPFEIDRPSSMGGAHRRMIDNLMSMGYIHVHVYYRTFEGGSRPWKQRAHEITAKGLRAIHATADEIYARERLEREREVAREKQRAKNAAQVDAWQAERKANIIAKVREELTGVGGFTHLADDALWHWITRIVEIHEGTA